MTWRGTATPTDRIFGILPYLLPLSDAVFSGGAFFRYVEQFPPLIPVAEAIRVLALPAVLIQGLIPFGSLVIFMLLIFLVVRNPRIGHFIRFNTLQAILIGFIIFVCSLLIGVFETPSLSLLTETLSNVVFLGGLGMVLYSMVQSGLGRYAEIPTISEAVHMQVR
ncbi:MAG: Tic20 family protein [Cyanobacteria bacterium P01_A01_bin.105]